MILILAIFVLLVGLSFIFEIAPRYIKSMTDLTTQELKSINLHKVCFNIGFIILLLSAVLFISYFNPLFKERYLFMSTLIWCAICIIDTIYMQKSHKYFRNE